MKTLEYKVSLSVVVVLCFAMIFGAFACPGPARAASNPQEIKIAVIAPLSGALSRNGNLYLEGIKAAINWVNDNGGIKSMKGAKLVPVIGDTGTTVEGAASAMERLCRDPDITMAIGSWGSSLTMAATEITERLGIPHFSEAFSDSLNQRGFKWGFYVDPPGSVFGDLGLTTMMSLAKSAGVTPKTYMIVGDNQAASLTNDESAKAYFSKVGVKEVGDESWPMGALTDPTAVMQKVKKTNPNIVIFSVSAMNEIQMILMKRKELGVKTPMVASTGMIADPSFRTIGAEDLEGLMAFSPCFPHKLTPPDWIKRTLAQCKKDYSDEPWMAQELTYGFILVPVMAEVLERAGTKDHQKLWETARKLDLHDVLATRATVKQGMAFDDQGRIAKKYQGVVFVQWQSGVSKTVYPPDLAFGKPIWPKK